MLYTAAPSSILGAAAMLISSAAACTVLLLRRYRAVCDSFDLIRYRRVVGRCLVLEQL